ncbi:MAG: anhydro-N-acetylmuramic acid kinase, partial [Bacteroidales bacterium]|nr:anhydro-N-acetylmuramic acid kinase [Bacteroidales bacterium]
MTNNQYNVIGVMSGTSLDGLDIVLCNFEYKNQKWSFEIIKAETFKYDNTWKNNLSKADLLNSFDFISFHKEYGKYIGSKIIKFIKNCIINIDFIASHGHTIFHQPEKNITFQIGDGAEIAATTSITTISDFRTLDVALGGQGAPLVPIGDKLLFSQYDYCLNLGGFANISYNIDNKRIAFDICPANIIINYLIKELNLDYDKDGKIAKQGQINSELLNKLNQIDYYRKSYPKSLGKEDLLKTFIPVLEQANINVYDKLRTIYENIAIQISNSMPDVENSKSVFITGGGAYNKFLIELLLKKIKNKIIIPEPTLIEYKEALIFAFLGVLRYRNEINCLSSVTGASQDNTGGIINSVCKKTPITALYS